jgi:hypothetical protein
MRIAAGLIVPALAAGLFFVPMADMADAGGRKGGAHAKAGGGMKGMRAGGMRMRGAHMRGMRKGGGHGMRGVRRSAVMPCVACAVCARPAARACAAWRTGRAR